MKTAIALMLLVLYGRAAAAGPITADLEGCVAIGDRRLTEAIWQAAGTFQAVAFDDPTAGCAPTIAGPVSDAFVFDDNRTENTLKAWLNLDRLPTCGRRQYDLQPYLESGVLDATQLKSLVIDSGVSCFPETVLVPVALTGARVPEPWSGALIGLGALAWRLQRWAKGRV